MDWTPAPRLMLRYGIAVVAGLVLCWVNMLGLAAVLARQASAAVVWSGSLAMLMSTH